MPCPNVCLNSAPMLGQPQVVYEVRPRSPMRMEYPPLGHRGGGGRSPPPRMDDHRGGPLPYDR